MVRRRRRCTVCHKRFTTYETAELRMPTIVKGNGQREDFSRKKLETSFHRALHKRPVAEEAVAAAVDVLRAAGGAAAEPVRAVTCPRCGQPNDCAPARTGDFTTPCWCVDVVADPAVLAALPAAMRGGACLCRRCLTATRAGRIDDAGP